MNRKKYFDYIEEKLNELANRINSRGKLNILDLNLHSENFYCNFFNLLYNYSLKNVNAIKQNVEGIDLIDENKKIVVQVSATSTKQKIESALEKDIMEEYKDYNFKFISISKDASDLRDKKYKNPFGIKFNPIDDIYDIHVMLKTVNDIREIDRIKELYNFIKKELGEEVDIVRLDTNLAIIINILAKEQWDDTNKTEIVDSFEIERKISYNELIDAKSIIDEYFVYYKKVDEKYSMFDESGVNKSISVLASIKKEYLKYKKIGNSDEIFFAVIENIKQKIINSGNFERIPIDELELCVDILVVDAFTRCKIFENPERYKYVNS